MRSHAVNMFERILVGFDGSPHSRRAVQLATEIAGRFQSTLTIAVVHPTVRGEELARLEALVPFSEDGRTLSTILEELRNRALAHGARVVEPVTLHGEVLDSLLDYLSRNPQDLIVVGSRGLSRSRRLLLGSVSTGLVNSAHCPVLVVRPGPPHPGKPTGHAEAHPSKPSAGGAG
jgi:nucleotide-binding universal stress UspA family protein